MSTILNVLVCIASLFAAWIDHGETYAAYKASKGQTRRGKGLKLLLLWGIPIVSFAAALFSWREVVTSEREAGLQARALINASNRLAVAEAKQAPRRISADQKARLLACLASAPKGKIEIAASMVDAEATGFAENIEDVLTNLSFEVHRPSVGTNGKIPPDAYLAIGNVGLSIVVQNPKRPPLRAAMIQRCFRDCGIQMEGMAEPAFDSNRVEIVVGQREQGAHSEATVNRPATSQAFEPIPLQFPSAAIFSPSIR